ncbi:HEAT repeat domain-containing protein [Kitasatospora sp. NPDC048407]|uniref:HEAT repeat domain-containing protein n=1 Tax=Kitasatospora sp. NPDC048407 TaxID=3364051 RepID=UPI0037225298
MFEGLDEIDWSKIGHAYGTAEEVPALLRGLASAEEETRGDARSRFYSAVHHQGDVYRCTAASLPFLFELAQDAAAPDRAAVIELLVSIGGSALERLEFERRFAQDSADAGTEGQDAEADDAYRDYVGHPEAAALVRERAEAFIGFTAEPDRLVRQAAIPALGLFVDDAERAFAVLRERLAAEPGAVERLLVLRTTAVLALRRPEVSEFATAWFGELLDDAALDPTVRLGALVERARCVPGFDADEAVRAAIGLLREQPAPADDWWHAPTPATPQPAIEPGSAPAHVIAAFEELDRDGKVHSPVTGLLSSFHEVLNGRVAERTELLAQQLRSEDAGARMDALRMAKELIRSWRGDHGPLIALIGDHLADPRPQVVAEAAAALAACGPLAESARPALAAFVAERCGGPCEQCGPRRWAHSQRELRRAHQEAALALARLGDERALPSLLVALDDGVDAWRAIPAAGHLPGAAGELAPRLVDRLRGFDLQQEQTEQEVAGVLAALGRLADPAGLGAVEEALDRAVRDEQWPIVRYALRALRQFGPAAAPALPAIRALAGPAAPGNAETALAAITTLWAVGADPDEVLPLLLPGLDDDGGPFRAIDIDDVADLLGAIGPAAAAALPRLRERATGTDWHGVHCAAALWDIGGESEAQAVLNVLLPAWENNAYTGRVVVPCLERMGPAARPAASALQAQLALPGRGEGLFTTIEEDENLQRACRAALARLDQPDAQQDPTDRA